MASYITGKFAIGKVDCTTEKSICKSSQFNIKGYPSLKIYKDGNFFDYPGKRDPDSMIEFMEKMSLPSVALVHSFSEFETILLNKGNAHHVSYVAFDVKGSERNEKSNDVAKNTPSANVTPVEKILSSTPFLQMYGQSSRVLQSISSFTLLHPKSKSELRKFLEYASSSSSASTLDIKSIEKKGHVVLRIEKDTSPMIYDSDSPSSSDIMTWMKDHYMPLVTTLEGHNFRTVTSIGKPLVIGVTKSSENENEKETSIFINELREIAQFGSNDIKNNYKFTSMNGQKFHAFLKQFNITTDSRLPQAIIVNTQNRTFYQNESFTSVKDFLSGVENGLILEQQSEDKNQDFLSKIVSWFMKFMPYSVIGATILLAFLCWFVVMMFDDNDDATNESSSRGQVTLTESQLKYLQQRRAMEKKVNKKKTMKED